MAIDAINFKEYIDNPVNCANIKKARKTAKELNMHVNGVDVESYLEPIKGYENKEQYKLKKKLARSNRSMSNELLRPIDKIFSAHGSSEYVNMSDNLTEDFKTTKYKGYSIDRWLRQNINKYYVDPNGLFFVEWKAEGKEMEVYPTYKSIHDIYDYKRDGLKVEWCIFEPFEREETPGIKYYRFVNDEYDYLIAYENESYQILEDETYKNPIGEFPGILISDIPHDVYNIMQSPYEIVMETAMEYLQNQASRSIYKYLHLYPIFWKYLQDCPSCKGTGYIDGKTCGFCRGTGFRIDKDITDSIGLRIPERADEPTIAPDVAGFVQPDLATLQEIRIEVRELFKEIQLSFWGTYTMETLENVTATGVFANQEAGRDRLDDFSEWYEYSKNGLMSIIGKIKYQTAFKSYNFQAGRRYLFELPDTIIKRYGEYKEGGYPKSLLDYTLDQYYMTQFSTDNKAYIMEMKKLLLEPFKHDSIEQVQSYMVEDIDKKKKAYFDEWVKTIPENDFITKTYEQLDKSLIDYANNKSINQTE